MVSNSALILKPLRVVVLPIKLTITSCVNNGFPRQFCVIYANIRCSILFHLLVPGGKWLTATFSPVSLANCWSSRFGSDIPVMLALRRSSRQVVVADKQLDGPDMLSELLGTRQRFADEP